MKKNKKYSILLNNMRIIFSLFAFLLIATYANANNNKERFYIMPYEQQEAIKDLTNSIMQAKTKIDIAIYSFTNREIAKALREASNKGVKINIIYDSGQKKAENSTIGYLEKFDNIHTCLLEGKTARNGKYNGIMHQKMIIIDDNLIGLGSANWSKNAFENNYETLYFTYSTDTVKKASHYFKDMLKQCKPFI